MYKKYKKYKTFLCKKITPKWVVLQSWKKLQVIFDFFKKINPSRHTTSFQRLYDVYTTSATSYRRIIEVEATSCVYWNGSQDTIFNFWWFGGFEKLFFTAMNKTQTTENQKNPAHCFGENCLTNHLTTSLQDKLLEWALTINFFYKKLDSESSVTGFNFA